jgi:hypothetical protein
MQDTTNTCNDRIEYELSTNLDRTQSDLSRSAVETTEEILAIIGELQEVQNNEPSDIRKPMASIGINTIKNLSKGHLSLAILFLVARERGRR